MSTQPTSPAASAWSRFVPIRFHARGGLGEVLVARDTELNRHVALKRSLGPADLDPRARRRFLLEAEITARLEHPGVVPVYGLGTDPQTGQPCYAMRFITGRSLKIAIDELHRGAVGFDGLAFRKLLSCVVSVCRTVGFAHSRGVLHRDLKPSNVMVGGHGETLVVDWGLAKEFRQPEPSEGLSPAVQVLSESALAEPPADPSALTLRAEPRPDDPSAPSASSTGTGSSSAGSLGSGSSGTVAGLAERSSHDFSSVGSSGRVVGSTSVPTESLRERIAALMRGSGVSTDARGLSEGLTRTGQTLGTLGYMAPEQVLCMPELLTPSADVYSLGATLYHVLTGQRPMEGSTDQHILMATVMGTVTPPSAARPTLGLPAGLEAVCRKAMRLEPAERYATASAMADDLEAWLADEPVSCLPERPPERAKRWMRRHPTTVATSLAVVLLLGSAAATVAGLVNAQREALAAKNEEIAAERDRAVSAERATAQQRDRANQERDRANQERDRANQERDRAVTAEKLAADNFAEARKVLRTCLDLAREHPVFQQEGMQESRKLLLQAAAPFHERFADLSGTAKMHVEAISAKMHAAVLSAETKSKPEALELYHRSVHELEAVQAVFPGQPLLREGLAMCHHQMGNLLAEMGKSSEARRELSVARRLLERLLEEAPKNRGYQTRLGTVHNDLGVLLSQQGDRKASAEAHALALTIRKELLSAEPTNREYRSYLADSHFNIAMLLRDEGDRAAAEREHQLAATIRRELVTEEPGSQGYRIALAKSHGALGYLRAAANDRAGAEREYRAAMVLRKVLAERNPAIVDYQAELAKSLSNLGYMVAAGGEAAEGTAMVREAVTIWARLVEQLPQVVEYRRDLTTGRVLYAMLLVAGDPAEAVRQLRLAGPGARPIVQSRTGFDPLRSRDDFRALLAEWDRAGSRGDAP